MSDKKLGSEYEEQIESLSAQLEGALAENHRLSGLVDEAAPIINASSTVNGRLRSERDSEHENWLAAERDAQEWASKCDDQRAQINAWKKATECDTPEDIEQAICTRYEWLHAWHEWARKLLKAHGLQLENGWHGDREARELLEHELTKLKENCELGVKQRDIAQDLAAKYRKALVYYADEDHWKCCNWSLEQGAGEWRQDLFVPEEHPRHGWEQALTALGQAQFDATDGPQLQLQEVVLELLQRAHATSMKLDWDEEMRRLCLYAFQTGSILHVSAEQKASGPVATRSTKTAASDPKSPNPCSPASDQQLDHQLPLTRRVYIQKQPNTYWDEERKLWVENDSVFRARDRAAQRAVDGARPGEGDDNGNA